jgi:hypothetical protein
MCERLRLGRNDLTMLKGELCPTQVTIRSPFCWTIGRIQRDR